MKAEHFPEVLTASPSLHVIEVDPQTDPRWEALVTSSPASLVYQHPLWLQVLEEAYGYKPVHLACEDAAGQVRGILPLFYRRGLLSGRRLSSLFHSAVAGPLADDAQVGAALVQAAIERTRAEPGAQLHIQVPSNTLDGLVDDLVGMPIGETHLLALPEQATLLHLNKSTRWAIKKAQRLGVQIRPAESESELRAWYVLYLQTMHRLDVMPQPYRFFESAWRHLRPRGLLKLLLAEHTEAGQRKLIAGYFYLLWGQTISHIFTGWRKEEQTLQASDALHWQAIQDACAAGLRWYDFGGEPQDRRGLVQYKSKWGSVPRMAFGYIYPAPPAGMRSNSDQSSISSAPNRSRGAARKLMRTAWRHLPIKALWLLSGWRHTLHYY